MRRDRSTELLDRLPWGAFLLDRDGTVLHVNPMAEAWTGRPASEFLGSDFFEAFAALPGMAEAGAAYRERGEGGTVEPDVAVPGAPPDAPARIRFLLDSSAGGGDGRGLVLMDDRTAARELDRLREIHAAALLKVAHVRHEINNPLMGVLGLVELLLARSDLDEGVRRRLESIASETHRIRGQAAELASLRETGKAGGGGEPGS